jgi:hypothetical protein
MSYRQFVSTMLPFYLMKTIGSKPKTTINPNIPAYILTLAFIPYFLLYLLTIIFLTNKKIKNEKRS